LVEQRIENPRVGGSIPPQATSIAQQARPLRWAFAFLAQADSWPGGGLSFGAGSVLVLSAMQPVFAGPPMDLRKIEFTVG
jgi:hypothetical protein